MGNSNEYMRKYMRERYHRRRQEAIKQLGGRCRCGSRKNLQIDHIDRTKKSFDLGAALASWSEERVQEELKKCQVLCDECHKDKSLQERGFQKAKGQHGTHSSYRYCHCEECKRAHRDWCRKYRERKKRGSSSTGS